jgi:hypothetical protein
VTNDRLHFHIRDGVRTVFERNRGAKIKDGIERARQKNTGTADDEGPGVRKARKSKSVYLVDPKKFDSVATPEERSTEFSLGDLGDEDTHRILQSKVRYVR